MFLVLSLIAWHLNGCLSTLASCLVGPRDDVDPQSPSFFKRSMVGWSKKRWCCGRSTSVGVSNKHRLVNLYLMRVRLGWCTNGHKVYTGSG